MTQLFTIFHDSEYLEKSKRYSNMASTLKSYQALLNTTANSFHEHCYFDTNSPFEKIGFYAATEENNKVCLECVTAKDPQIINIMNFITSGKDYEAKLNKLNIGMTELRRIVAVSDPNASKCPVCAEKRAYKQTFDGHYGFKCNNCQIGYVGAGVFYYNGSNYTLPQAKKIYKMKAFK